ncbi:EAL domain-containing protein [Guyparkeria hydrothermalis]|uniref:EAL domain-containing response regulator n=1 Tax=Guyparkeria hydrothermalis TaxID=923 RepID=UPI00202187D2|nr:EAL domain-containing protein [Guyparkeria hydrothermalis]
MTLVESIENTPFSILHITGSVNDSIALRGELRNAGLQAGVHNAPDFDAARQEIAKNPVDVIYVEFENSAEQMLTALNELADREPALKGVPIVVYDDTADAEQVEGFLEAGAFVVIEHEALVEPLLMRAVATGLLHKDRENKVIQLAKSELRCQKLIDGSAEAVAYIQDGLHIYANRAYLDLLGFDSIDDLLEEPILDLAAGDSAQRLKAFLKTEDAEDTFTFRTNGGHEIDVRVNSTAASFDGEPCLQIFANQVKEDVGDISEQLEYFARRDLLTGLYNRNYLFEQIEARRAEIEAEEEGSGALLLLEILNHEEIKRHIGTTGMDNVLTEFGKKIEERVGGQGLVARHGAFSFLTLLGRLDRDHTAELAHALNELAREYVFTQGTTSVTVITSAGYLVLDENSPPNAAELVDRVERASNRAAQEGEYQARLYEPDIKTASEREQDEAWARKIKAALRESRFSMVFQPIVSLTGDREISRYEVFVRMVDEDGTLISPAEFLSQAERGDLIQSIDRWVVLSAIKQIHNGVKAGEKPKLYIRISDASLHDPEFSKWLVQRLQMTRLPDTLLAIQVSVNKAGHALRHLADMQEAMRPLGGELILDGFGSGEDGFRILDHLPVSTIKIARRLLENFAQESANQDRVGEVVQHAKQADMAVIVPNVENAASLQVLWPLGVDFVQGDFIQAPQESLEFDFAQF